MHRMLNGQWLRQITTHTGQSKYVRFFFAASMDKQPRKITRLLTRPRLDESLYCLLDVGYCKILLVFWAFQSMIATLNFHLGLNMGGPLHPIDHPSAAMDNRLDKSGHGCLPRYKGVAQFGFLQGMFHEFEISHEWVTSSRNKQNLGRELRELRLRR